MTEDHTDALVAALPATRAELAAQFDLPGQALPHALHRAAIAGRLAMTPGDAPSPPAPGTPLARARRASSSPSTSRPRPTATRPSTSSRGATTRATRAPTSATSRTGPGSRCATAVRPTATELDDGPVPDVLIPAFDELLLGWRDRTPTVPPEHAKRVHPGGGILRAVALEDGVAVGTWSRAGGRISVERF